MDDGHGAELRHDGAVDIALSGGDGLDGLHAPQVDLRLHPHQAQLGAAVGGDGLFVRGGLALDQQNLVLPGRHIHYTRPERQYPVGRDLRDGGLHAHGLDLHRVPHLHRAGGLLVLHRLRSRAQGLRRPVQAAAKLASGLVDPLGVLLFVGVFFHLVQLGEGLLGGGSGLGNDPLRLPAGLLIRLFQPYLQLRLQESGLFGALLRLTQLEGGLVSVLFQKPPGLLQLLDGGFKAGVFRAHPLFRVLNDVLPQAETPGDGKGVGFARDAH